MPTRVETAAATRQALLDAAGALLDSGGPNAVTLRQVGARAGVTRSAPYRHFADKESLLTALATQAWSDIGDTVEALAFSADPPPKESLRIALGSLVTLGRSRPHLYRLMFTTPVSDPTAAVRAAERAQNLYLEIVGRCIGPEQVNQYGGLLMTSVHGIVDFELSGHLTQAKWHSTAEDLVELLINLLPLLQPPRVSDP